MWIADLRLWRRFGQIDDIIEIVLIELDQVMETTETAGAAHGSIELALVGWWNLGIWRLWFEWRPRWLVGSVRTDSPAQHGSVNEGARGSQGSIRRRKADT